MKTIQQIITAYAEAFMDMHKEDIMDAIMERIPEPDIDEIADAIIENTDICERIDSEIVETIMANF